MADERFALAVKTNNAIAALLNAEGWKMLDAVLAERQQLILNELLNPEAIFSDSTLREHRIRLQTIQAIRDTPAIMQSDAKLTIEQFNPRVTSPDATSSEGSSP